MKADWAHLKTAIERAIHSAENGERGSLRVHCKSAERMLKGARTAEGKDVLDKVHHAGTSLDLERAINFLKEALTVASAQVAEA